MTKHICNKCGKELDLWDLQEARSLHDIIGYGSKYDGFKLDLDLCCQCFDEIIDYLKSNCKYNFLEDLNGGN